METTFPVPIIGHLPRNRLGVCSPDGGERRSGPPKLSGPTGCVVVFGARRVVPSSVSSAPERKASPAISTARAGLRSDPLRGSAPNAGRISAGAENGPLGGHCGTLVV